MRGGYLDRSLETIAGSPEIHHRSSTQTYVIDICTGISQALYKIFMYLVRRHPAVPAHKHLVGPEKFRNKIPDLIGGHPVEVHIVDPADIICMKRSHIAKPVIVSTRERAH